jgi:hypothetical protein
MNIEGTYKVNIEQTVRKIGESEEATIERMLGYVGLRPSDIPPDPKREAKIQTMIAEQEQDELATSMRLEITSERASIRSIEDSGDYPIRSHSVAADGKHMLVIHVPDGGDDIQWEITVVGDRFLVFGGPEEDEMSGFVWERV